jgi:peptidyl-prolyl cis-trans isomerase A (cyclophilin A)
MLLPDYNRPYMRHCFIPRIAGAFALCACALAQSDNKAQTSPTHRILKPSAPAVVPVTVPTEPGLYAVIYTSMGNIVCRLFDKDAPKTVANFRGLATGTKTWTDPETNNVKHTPLYSGTTFHRVIPQFMIQGGDPTGTGMGSPGYQFEDELDASHTFDHPGILAMANSGPNTNGSQFFITVAPTPWLNGKHTIFGEVVSGQEFVDAISQVPRDEQDKPLTSVKILRISIRPVRATQTKPKTPGEPIKKQG